jgi:hypothetical protein
MLLAGKIAHDPLSYAGSIVTLTYMPAGDQERLALLRLHELMRQKTLSEV